MRTTPSGLDERVLVEVLEREWCLLVDALTYVPKGAGSYHWVVDTHDGVRRFVTVDDLDRKPWLGSERDDAFEGMRAAFATTRVLREHAGLAFVVAPVAADDGRVVIRVSDRYCVAMFPFIDGDVGEFAGERAADELEGVVDILIALHQATPLVPGLSRRGLELAGRADLESALDATDVAWTSGPLGEQARELLRVNRPRIAGWLAVFDDLTSRVARRDDPLVLTHGEPHRGNFIRAGDTRFLIDWDTVGLAPPERDLWMLADGAPLTFDRYRAGTGRDVDLDAVELYRLTWTLADVAAYSGQLRLPHERTPDTEKAWDALLHYLS